MMGNLWVTYCGCVCVLLFHTAITVSAKARACKPKPRFSPREMVPIRALQGEWKKSRHSGNTFKPTSAQAKFFNSLNSQNQNTNRRFGPSDDNNGTPRRANSGCVYPTRTRMEYRQMSRMERNNFHRALRAMMSTKIDGLSQYHIFVRFHNGRNAPSAHEGAAFLPWHREYLFRLENALRKHVAEAFLPYWDSTLDRYLPSSKDSVLWNDELLGDNTGTVTTGTFANWSVIPECGSALRRSVGSEPDTLLFDNSDIEHVLSLNTFEDINTDRTFERTHDSVHVWVGGNMNRLRGQMSDLPCAPSDPVFFMHHAFVDCLWETFRQTSQTTPLTEYRNHTRTAHWPNAAMNPFKPYLNKRGVSTFYTRCYTYALRPSWCSEDWDCGSYSYLFCHRGRCMSKVRVGGDCTGLPDKACFSSSFWSDPRCEGNKCVLKYPWGNT